jgi:hypothetical protein
MLGTVFKRFNTKCTTAIRHIDHPTTRWDQGGNSRDGIEPVDEAESIQGQAQIGIGCRALRAALNNMDRIPLWNPSVSFEICLQATELRSRIRAPSEVSAIQYND